MVYTDGCGYIAISTSTSWTPSVTWAALRLQTDWLDRMFPPLLLRHRWSARAGFLLPPSQSPQICWLKTTPTVCGSKYLWGQLGPPLRVSQGQKQGVGQSGLLSRGTGEESTSICQQNPLLAIVGLTFLFPYWLVARIHSLLPGLPAFFPRGPLH